MKNIIKKLNRSIKNIFQIQIVAFVLIFSFLFNPSFALADSTPPVASAPTSTPQPLGSGATSTSTVQMNEAGNIYLVKSGTGPSATSIPSADLTNLVISGSPSNYTFAAGTYNYNGVTVLNGVASVTVTPTGAGTITVNGTTVASGVASGAIALTAGTESVIDVITTESGKAPKLYTIRITRNIALAVGVAYQGGVIVNTTTKVIAGLTDLGPNIWGSGCSPNATLLPATAGVGATNTAWMIANCGGGTIATTAQAYRGGGYSDWYVPTQGDFDNILSNSASIGGWTTNRYYYTSTIYSGNNRPYSFNITTWGNQTTPITDSLYFRPVRTYTGTTPAALPTQTAPTFSVNGGVVAAGTTVTITSSGADAIYYTTNGTAPTTSSTNQATTPLVINSNVTVRALAVKAGYNKAEANMTFVTGVYDWSTVINTNHTAFLGKSSAVANTPYTITVPVGLVEGVYDIVAVDTSNNISATVPGWLTVDNTAPTVALTYTANPKGVGTQTITATYSEAVTSAPNISINQPGTTDISNVAMSGSGTVYTYSYTVNAANGSTYIDGTATVSLSATTDAAGNNSASPTNNTFDIDTTGPTVALTYSEDPANAGAMTITATYSKTITSAPNISINQPGTTDISNVAMSGSGTVYTYSYTVNAANGSTYIDGTATVNLSATTDTTGNPSSTPTNNTFIIDTTGPTVALTYSANPAPTGAMTITATYSEAPTTTPNISINQPGTTDISNVAMTVPPLESWISRTSAVDNLWRSVIYGNGLFVAVAASGTNNRVMTSPDGITWTPRTSAADNNWMSVTYGNGLFVAVSNTGIGNRVMTSPDGITWTPRTSATDNNWMSVIYGNGLFVATATSGTNNRVMTSPDGITWTPRTNSVDNNWASVTYGNGLFVATATSGTNNRVMTSPDGITWTPRTSAADNYWSSVTYGNGLFVAVSNTGIGNRVMTSPDGITWTPRTSAVDNSWSSVTYGNGLFVAVANSGTNNRVMTSPDGITWTPRTTPVDNSWIGVTYGNGLFVAVSATGTNDRVMTFSSNGIYYTYSYTVNAANGSTYIDGTATVSLSTTVDAVGNSSSTPTNNTFTIDTAGPTVALTYSANPAPTGAMTITATYSEAPTTTPNISINQPGTTDISNVAMSGSGTVYTYSYTVNTANGSTYIDGTATVSLSATTDAVGYSSSAPTNNTFAIDTVGPTATVTYSIDRTVKGGESLVITATFNKVVADAPVMKIGISGANTVSATNMTKVDTTHYTYTHTVGAGDGVATVALSVGTDLAGNVVTSSPTSGATFSVDNILPSSTIDAICSTLGNGCTGAGALADPQESYSVQSIKGTASDNEGGSGLSSVKISIKDTTTNLWYSGSSFADGTETYLTATGTTAWSFNSSAMALTIDHVYLIHVKSIDLATNEESPVQALSFKFVNSPPTVSNVTASQDSSGVVNISFDVSDIESSQTTNYLFYGIGATLNGAINSSVNSLTVSDATYLSSSGSIIIDDEIITYTSKTGNVLNGLTRGALSTTASSHNNASSVYAKATTVTGTGVGLVNVGTGKTMVWTAGTDIDGYENLSEVIKVVVNDGSTGSMIGSLVSATFAFDTLKPTAVVTFDAGIAGVTNSATITIPMPVDQSTVEYKISDDAVSQTNPTNSGWVTMTQSTTIPWTFDSDVEAKTIKYQYRDAYGNISNEVSISTLAPVAANSFLVQDSSNINISTYDMYIGWGEIVDLTGFSAYKIEYATSDDNVTYGSYTAVTADGMSNPTTNYYVHRLLNPNKYYKYRLGVVGTNGNVSVRAGAPIVAKPDGVQNYGEGGSGSEAVVITASKVENVVPVQGVDKNVTITYLLTDSSSASKTNPSYEAYLFYNIGVTLPSSPLSGDNLTVSDASKLKSSGFIQINNEIIKYTSKTGNVLSGLTRSTWPTNGTTRTTRTNTTFFSGTPVWIMASSATPVQITNTSIVTGQNGSIAWDTNSETTLSGSVYTNVGIRVLVHDNQTTESLSTQSDFSEIGILNTLDLNSPTISFSTASASGVETTSPVTATLNLSRAYPLDVSINYAVTGTATSGDDYTLASGTETITAGQTTKSISIPIINDAVSEFDETIIVTISSPTNARLGANTVFTYTIEDNLLPTLAFNALTSQSNEDVNTVNIPVSISAAYSDNVTFSYVVTGGTADGDSVDYLLANGTGTITAGNTSTDISLTIFDDSISESTETIIVTISNPTNAVLGSNQNHVYSILDNEIEVTSVTGGNIKSTSARITWTTDDFTNSLLEYGIIAPGTEGAYNLSKTNSEKVLNHSIYIDNLTPSTTYYFKTTSVNLDNEDTIVESSFTTTAGPVTTGVSSSAVTDTTATITWTTDIPASSYVNYSKDSSLASPTRFGTAELTTDHSVALTGLDAGSNYYYYVDGTDTDGNNGENANAGSYYTFTTAADQTAPVISAISSPIVTPTEVAIVWTTNELANGKVMYGTTSGSYTNETELISTPLINHLVTISGLTKVTKYYYVVVSADSNSNTTTSAEQNFTTGDVETVTVVSGGGGGGVMGVARELYDILLAENATYKSKLKDYDDKIPVISNIQINDITAFGALVSFETSEDTIVFIDYGKDESYGLIAADKGWSKIHTVKIYGLSLGTEYNFKISAIDRSNDTGYSDNQKFTTKFLTEDLAELKKIENVEQFQDEIESTIESILPSLVPPFIDKPVVSDITENSATITFRTNIKAYPIVSYAAENKYDATKLNPYDGEMSDTSEKKVLHTLSLVSLAPNTKYHVMVKAYSLPQVVGKSEDFVFTTEASKIQGSILDIKKDSFTVVWQTDEATSSIIEYKNLSTGKIARMVDDVKNISHSVLVENLSPGTLYQVNISGINDKGNIVEGSAPLNVKTSTDNTPPVITNLKVDSSLVAGRTDKVQVIVSWQTDEASTSTVYYEEGSGSLKGSLANKQQDEELTKNHVVIMTSLKPGTVYRFTVESKDDANNIVKPPIRTIITPKKAESIVDVIFKNFNETFNFINNVR